MSCCEMSCYEKKSIQERVLTGLFLLLWNCKMYICVCLVCGRVTMLLLHRCFAVCTSTCRGMSSSGMAAKTGSFNFNPLYAELVTEIHPYIQTLCRGRGSGKRDFEKESKGLTLLWFLQLVTRACADSGFTS